MAARRFVVGVLLLALASAASTSLDLTGVDFSDATASLAGPGKIYLRGIQHGEETYSLVIEMLDAAGNTWQISDPASERESTFSESFSLDFVTIQAASSNTLQISGILVDDVPYTGLFQLNSNQLQRIAMIKAESMPEHTPQRIAALVDILSESEWQELSQQSSTLRANVTMLSSQNATLKDTIASLQEDNRKLKQVEQEAAFVKERIQTLTEENAALKQSSLSMGSAKQENEALRASILSFSEEKELLAAQFAALEAENGKLVERLSALQTENSTLKTDADQEGTLAAQVRSLTQENEQLRKDNQTLEAQVSELMKYPSLAALRSQLARVLLAGFGKAMPHIGTWEIVNGVAYQKDPGQYFAELVFPLKQFSQPTLFSFSGRATGKAWVGFGLHLFVSNNPGKKGYGLGDSLLVWLTRDARAYGDEYTYLQLYRSYDAVNMERVLNARIEELISEYVEVEVLYDPVNEYITVSVDGTEKIRYKTWFDIDVGVEMALRTLKEGVSFKDLLVLTAE